MINFIILMQGLTATVLIFAVWFFWPTRMSRAFLHTLFWVVVLSGLVDVAADEYWPASIAFLLGFCTLSTLRVHRVEFPDDTAF